MTDGSCDVVCPLSVPKGVWGAGEGLPNKSGPDPWLEACAQTRVGRAQACAVLGGKCS